MKNTHLYIAKVVTTLSTFLFNIYLAKVAGISYFGIFSLLLNITFIYNFINDWGFSMFGPLEVNRQVGKIEKAAYIQKVFNFKIIATVGTIILYLATIFLFYKEHVWLLSFGVLVLASNLFNLDWLLRAYSYFKMVSIRQIVNAVLNLTFVVLIFVFQLDVVFVFASYGLALLISLLIALVFLLRKQVLVIKLNQFKHAIADSRNIIGKTKTAFLGLFIFNLIYALNIPLLTYFANDEATSFYASYYNIFASVVAVVAIAQDIYLPKFKREHYHIFFRSYARLLYAGLLCVVLVLSCLPFYYNLIYPATFTIDIVSVTLVSLLGFLFSYRLLYLHAYLVINNYSLFFAINMAGLVIYGVLSLLLIFFNLFNQNTAFVTLIVAESAIILFSIKREKLFSTSMLINTVIVSAILSFNYLFFGKAIAGFVFAGLLLIMLLVFYKRLVENFIPNEDR